MEWITPLVSGTALIIVAIIEAVAMRERKQDKLDKARIEHRAKIRERESHLSMEMMSATCALALVTAKKVNGKQTKGDVEESMEKAVKAQEGYSDFVREMAAHQVGKVWKSGNSTCKKCRNILYSYMVWPFGRCVRCCKRHTGGFGSWCAATFLL